MPVLSREESHEGVRNLRVELNGYKIASLLLLNGYYRQLL